MCPFNYSQRHNNAHLTTKELICIEVTFRDHPVQGVPKIRLVTSIEITLVVNLGLLHLWIFIKLAFEEQQHKHVLNINTPAAHVPFNSTLKGITTHVNNKRANYYGLMPLEF
jgi:hypothetical protein